MGSVVKGLYFLLYLYKFKLKSQCVASNDHIEWNCSI